MNRGPVLVGVDGKLSLKDASNRNNKRPFPVGLDVKIPFKVRKCYPVHRNWTPFLLGCCTGRYRSHAVQSLEIRSSRSPFPHERDAKDPVQSSKMLQS